MDFEGPVPEHSTSVHGASPDAGGNRGVWSLTDSLKIPPLLLSSCGTVTSVLEPQLGRSQYVLQKPGVPATHSLGRTVLTPLVRSD